MRTWFGRPSASMRLSAWTATATSVAWRPSARAQPVADRPLVAGDGGLGPDPLGVAGGLLPGHAPVLGDELQVPVALCGHQAAVLTQGGIIRAPVRHPVPRPWRMDPLASRPSHGPRAPPPRLDDGGPDERDRHRKAERVDCVRIVHVTETCDAGAPRLVVHAETTSANVHEATRTGPKPVWRLVRTPVRFGRSGGTAQHQRVARTRSKPDASGRLSSR